MIKEYFKITSEGAIRVKEEVKIIVKEKQVLISKQKIFYSIFSL